LSKINHHGPIGWIYETVKFGSLLSWPTMYRPTYITFDYDLYFHVLFNSSTGNQNYMEIYYLKCFN